MGTSAVVNRISNETLVLVCLVTIMIFVRTQKTLLRRFAQMGKEKRCSLGKLDWLPNVAKNDAVH